MFIYTLQVECHSIEKKMKIALKVNTCVLICMLECRWKLIFEKAIDEILDPIIKASNPNPETIWKVLELAMQCIQHQGNQRPAMNKVVQELRIAIDMENN
jgi:hypothetical protein